MEEVSADVDRLHLPRHLDSNCRRKRYCSVCARLKKTIPPSYQPTCTSFAFPLSQIPIPRLRLWLVTMDSAAQARYDLIRENLAEVLNPEILEGILAEGRHPRIYWGESV